MGGMAPPPETVALDVAPEVSAPDGSRVRILAAGPRGSQAHFELGPGQVAVAVRHRTVEELWYFLSGRGEMWRRHDGVETVVEVSAGCSLSIPVGTAFQFRCLGSEPLAAVGTTMPPWPGPDEAVVEAGPWVPTVTPPEA
jgi:mannose-6-phosphate isomerase-like protein (cupin superfamily)